MRVSIHALAAAGVLALAAPASAVTVQPLSASPSMTRAHFSNGSEGAGGDLKAAVFGIGSGASSDGYGRPWNAPAKSDAASVDLGALYAADPAGFLARMNESGPATNAARPASTQTGAPKAR